MAFSPIPSFHLVTAGDMSANITSPAFPIHFQDNAGIQLIWTGAPIGTFDIQASIDHVQDANGNISVAGTWTSLGMSSLPAPAGSGSSGYVAVNQLAAPYLRVVYTKSSGTGSLNIYVAAKGV